MIVQVLEKPKPIELVRWDGTNDGELGTYLANAKSDGEAWLVYNDDGSWHIASTYWPNKPLTVGDYVYAMKVQWAGPILEVYSSDEVSARYYPYPAYGLVE